MFNPNERRVAYKSTVWDRVVRGELMSLTLDLETSGLGRSGVPYKTPASAFITEYGDCLTDLSGNYLNSSQIFPKRPERLLFEPAAAILQRVQEMGPELFDGDERLPYWQAMAAIVWRMEQAAYAYEEMAKALGDEKKVVAFSDINKAFKPDENGLKQKDATEEVYEIPLKLDNGEVVYDVRYHPDRRKVAYRFTRDGQDWLNKEYRGEDNLYYQDKNDGSLWKWVDAGVCYEGYNLKSYDIPVFRTNLYRAGFSSANTTMMYSRATPLAKQRKKPHVVDVRDIARMVMMYGSQREDDLKIGRLVDPVTGEIRPSEALGAYLEENSRQGSAVRLMKAGPFMPDDGSYFDPKQAHGAMFDALATKALENFCMDHNPWLVAKLHEQADEKKLIQVLTQKTPKGVNLPLFSLARREGGTAPHTDMPHWFLGTDDQIGRFKKLIFLKADGSFHKERFEGTLLKDLSVKDMTRFLKSQERKSNADRAVREIPVNRWQGTLPVADVMQHTTQADRYRDSIPDMIQDCRYIMDNPELSETILQAMAYINHEKRFGRHHPQIEFEEDALPRKYGGKVYWQEEEQELERRLIWDKSRGGAGTGPRRLAGVLETINAGMNNDFMYFMRPMDEALEQLCITAHPVDFYMDCEAEADKPEDMTDLDKAVLQNFKDLAERLYDKFKKKEWVYLEVLQEIINPATGEPFFNGSKFTAQTPAQAYAFREALGIRAFESLNTLLHTNNPTPEMRDYLHQKVSKNFCNMLGKDGKRLLLFADPDNGQQNGCTPHVVDEKGAEISLEVLKGLNSHIDFQNGSNRAMRDVLDNLVNKGCWSYRFYQDPSNELWMKLIDRFVDLGQRNKVPRPLLKMYDADFINRHEGLQNETVTTDRMTTLRTMEQACKRLKIAASSGDSRLLERDPEPLLSEAAKALANEEGRQRLAHIEDFIKKDKLEVERRKAEIPGMLRRTDPESGMPYDYVDNAIMRYSWKEFEADPNFIVTDSTIWHMRHPVEQEDDRFPRKALIVPDLKKSFANAVNNKKKPVLVRCLETGQIYATGPSSVIELPKDDSVSIMRDKVIADYARAGIELTPKDKLYMLGIEGLYPLAGTRNVDFSAQSFKLPGLMFDGLTSPEYSSLGHQPIQAVLLPVDYYPQKLVPDEKVLLREMKARMLGNLEGDADSEETGHLYETTLRDVWGLGEGGEKEGIMRADFERMVKNGEIPKTVLEAAGFIGGSFDHVQRRLDEMAAIKGKGDPYDLKLVLATFDRVNEEYFKNGRKQEFNKWAYNHPVKAPKAALLWDGQPAPPGI